MSIVALVKCENYDYQLVKAAVNRGLDLLGGAGQFAKPNEKILLKPNFLIGDPPEKCTNTHFTVFKAVAEAFKQTGAQLSYGDSPAFGSALTVAKKCKIYDAARELGIPLVEFDEGKDVFFEQGIQNRKFFIAKPVLEAEGIISLPKLKTHGLTFLTGSIKNQFGCVPGMLKGEFHARLTDPLQFAQMLVDLNRLVKPRLYIMDGIIAMEGNGPRGGTPKPLRVLLFSTDPVALDATVCRLVGVDPLKVPIIRMGQEQGMGVCAESEIKIVGDRLDECQSKDFDMKTEVRFGGSGFKKKINDFLINLFGGLLVRKPYIVAEQCVKCGICVKQCPIGPARNRSSYSSSDDRLSDIDPCRESHRANDSDTPNKSDIISNGAVTKALDWDKGDKTKPPVYNYDQCIKCYCCQEVCPESAIKLKTPFLRWLFSKK